MKKYELALILAILALGIFFRFYLITQIPPGLYPDEAANGNNAVEALRTGEFKIFYPENNGREGLFINLQALAVWFFGEKPWALRLVSAFFGSLTIVGVFLLAKELFWANPRRALRLALFSSFFLAASFWHVNFSRIGFRAISIPFFAAFGLYFLLKGLRQGKIIDTVLAGVFIGLGFYTYIAFRFMPFAILATLAVYFWHWLKSNRGTRQPSRCIPCIIALFIFITLVVTLPLGFYFLENPHDFFGRAGEVSIFSAKNPGYEFLKSNALTIQMFFWRGDCNPRHNFSCQPQLFWPVAIFFAFGFLLAIRFILKETSKSFLGHQEARQHGLRQSRSAAPDAERVSSLDETSVSKNDLLASATLLALFFFMLFPATLTREGLPHALRSIGLIVPTFILAGWGAEYLWTAARESITRALAETRWQSYRPQLKRIKIESSILLALLLVFIAFNTFHTYFIRFPESRDTYYAFATDLVHVGEYLNQLPPDTKKIIIVNLFGDPIRGVKAPAQTPMFISDTFNEETRRAKHVQYLNELDALTLQPGEKVALIPLNPSDKPLLKEIKRRFPELQPKAPRDFVSFESRERSETGDKN